MVTTAMATSTSSSVAVVSLQTQTIREFNRRNSPTSYSTKIRKPINSTRQSLSPIQASSSSSSSLSSSSSASAVAIKTEPMVPPYNVLITGSTKGIGYALAKEFLKAGDNVVICSRSEERVKSALESLQVESGKQHVARGVMFERGTT